MNLENARDELARAREQALREAKAHNASLADAFVRMGKIEGIDLALSILNKAVGDSARRKE